MYTTIHTITNDSAYIKNAMQQMYYDMMPDSFASNIFNGYDLNWGKSYLQSGNNLFSSQPSAYMNPEYEIMGAATNSQNSANPFLNQSMPSSSYQIIPVPNFDYGNIFSQGYQDFWQENSMGYFDFQTPNNLNINNINQTKIGLIPQIQNSTLFNDKDKQKLAELNEFTQRKVLELKKEANKKGCDFIITSGYRSIEKQAILKEAWDTNDTKTLRQYGVKAKPAKPGYSSHNFRYAIDFRPTKGNAKIIGEIAESLGWTWGGRFNNNYDPIHIDLRGFMGSTDTLRANSSEYKAWISKQDKLPS